MLKVFATQVVISKGYDNKPAISITRGNDSAASVRFRIGKKVYDPKAENNARWLNYSVKGFGPIVDRIKKMQLKEGSFINIEGRLDEDTWEDQTTHEKKSCTVIILDEIEYASGGGKSSSGGNATDENVDTFLFGSKSEFDRLCLELVTKLKEKYPHVKRIYVRAEFPFINDDYRTYLLKSYDDTYYPEKFHGAGRAAYVERNYEMINNSKYCIVYYVEQTTPTTRKSGTKIALDYAIKKGREVILI